jgi:biotin carboxylase
MTYSHAPVPAPAADRAADGAVDRKRDASVRRGACVVVDAYSTGNALAGAFRAYGFDSVHVQSSPTVPATLTSSFRPADYADSVVHNGDVDALCAELLDRYPTLECVVAASEPGVPLADELCDHLGLAGNGSGLSRARRDKSVMADTVAAAHLPVIPHLCSSDSAEIRRWTAERELNSVVVKPRSSTGTVGFHICENDAELSEAVTSLLAGRDAFGDLVDEVIVQPFLEGDEYAVNAVSREGRHLITEVWRTRKYRRGQSKVYDLETLVDPASPEGQQVVDYTMRVLTALGIDFGPSHTEVIVGPSGPVLIESAARFMGAMDLSLVTRATGTNAVLLTAEAYMAPHQFLARVGQPQKPLMCRAAMVTLLASTPGTLRRWNVDALRSLDSFHGVEMYLAPGDSVVPTVDSFSNAGIVYLAAPTEDELYRDYERVREMEALGQLYEVLA